MYVCALQRSMFQASAEGAPPWLHFECMASSCLAAAGVHGLGSQSIHNTLSNSNCNNKGRNGHTDHLFYPLQRQLFNRHFKWSTTSHLLVTRHTPLKATPGGDQASENESQDDDTSSDSLSQEKQELFRKKLENIIGDDDAKFSGKDLAMLIRNKYGRSYDVQLIKKEFMGRQLLAMNVMWKYREQRSFPLTEEEYLLRLDDVANNLRCWGAVSYVRSSLAKTKERPRIGKAVSIFIDLDESGGRANEWIYR